MLQQEKVIKERIVKYNRRLQKLKDSQAEFGIHTPAHVLTRIEDAEEEIER